LWVHKNVSPLFHLSESPRGKATENKSIKNNLIIPCSSTFHNCASVQNKAKITKSSD